MKVDTIQLTPQNLINNQPTKVEDPGFAKILEQVKKSEDKAKLWDVCQQFESVFVNQLLQKMRETVPKNELFNGGMGEEVFRGMLDEKLSQDIAKAGGIGLAQMIFQQMSQSGLVRPPINGLPGQGSE